MATKSFVFPSQYARRVPDPNFKDQGIERHILFVPVRDVPLGLPLDPNARVPNIRRSVYKEVRESLKQDDGMFHLKHKGITVIAKAVEKKGDSTYNVTLRNGQGVVDGGHTYTLITSPDMRDELPENQFVKFEILTNVPEEWNADIAGGLNTSVQVQDMSLDNLAGRFDWLKELIKGEPYESAVAWRENEDGDVDARDLISMLSCFHIGKFPNNAGADDTQPVVAYEKKAAVLKLFEEDSKSYMRLAPIAKDIFWLHDIIRAAARNHWNESGGKFGGLAFVETKARGFVMPFTRETVDARLMTGASYPILAAFRWMVEEDPKTKKYRWKQGGFAAVLNLWNDAALELLRMTKQASDELGYRAYAVGKSRNHWANLFARVAMRDLLARSGAGVR